MTDTLSLQLDSYLDQDITLDNLRNTLTTFAEQQKECFFQHVPIADLVTARSNYIDQLLQRLWHFYGFSQQSDLAFVAVGGYGRGELHPLSDVDILILSEQPISDEIGAKVSEFITLLWDLRLEVGQSVRTVAECIDVGKNDLTVATNLTEARYLCGNKGTYNHLIESINDGAFWPSHTFYKAKLEEQKKRHARYHDTTYNLEPDIKSSPGGLRDIHTLSWVARRHFGATSLFEMSRHGFLTDAEYRELVECQNELWRIRFALHIELRRYDNRLTFDHQASVADNLGYQGEGNRHVEMMMKEFYRTLRRVAELNKMLLQLFEQAIITQQKDTAPTILDEDFQIRGNLIEATKPALFQARPETILDMFLHVAKNSEIEGIAAPTLRQLRTARRRLNLFLIEIPTAREKFMELVRQPNALQKAFRLMHRHGVLSAYLPQWSHIVGQMQFDLFHVYTVDEHSIRVIKNLNKFSDPENQQRHPICCEIYPRIVKKELLILAAIFHDIAKGRKGDHSELGAVDAYDFCIQHGLSRPEANIVSWLVKKHLLMSVTAQRRDIYDPEVVTEFAKEVRDEERLDYLVCLTVADICATNQDLWNSWKRTLLSELYYSTQKALRRGLENTPDVRDRIRHNQQLASAMLRSKGFQPREIEVLWQRFKADYFLRHTHKQLAWHAEALLTHDHDKPLILLSKKATRGGTEVFVYSKDKAKLFAIVVSELDKKNLSVHDAQIMNSKDGYTLDTFMVLDPNGKAINENRHTTIRRTLTKALTVMKSERKIRRAPRKLLHFNVKTKVSFLPTKTGKKTMMELVALDMPGLLAKVGAVFAEHNISLQAAKITTIGERAEDFFILVNDQGCNLSVEQQEVLEASLIRTINKHA
ncbi:MULTISPECIES: bifunctional uridylyltransferase/uridylyl-removing protein GlnD [unclassified Photobacterium]|uniref:bifunctional uridylyltransferase/uridylyl-removing protein GlnD n=1 Tax=unclassified Photobacterium TaxID=2628852 RepID=UPI001EE142AF|nr:MULTISPECIES: bifunctional uridylyltransferase/uridylyl-removing protein GlnD [unclassified Photobacterium]MCG3865562.1 bifunctional uridylyltransferase/uridylyl-removing protein GlnD [Photobacterium sp. Ph6]MCG3877063.1 bifunctional uridylyltransferase/uridylyl-removing protein GlnD [Photobacterium sp. Ph5]